MKISPSYDTLTNLIWICTVVAILAIRDISPASDELLNLVSACVLVIAIALGVFSIYRQRKMKRRAEDKVRMSDLILLPDIQLLAKSNSQLLEDAITLRCAQREQGAVPATRPVVQ